MPLTTASDAASQAPFDAVVVGGGPAGLQAALTLARGQRRVALLDGGPRRNARAHAVYNFLTRDGTPPDALRAAAHAELDAYGVVRVSGAVSAISGEKDAFDVALNGGTLRARRVLLATGMEDVLPPVPGLAHLWGDSVFQCPFCHGHPWRGQAWALKVDHPERLAHAALFLAWTDDLVVLVGDLTLDPTISASLERNGVRFERRAVTGLVAHPEHPERLGGIALADGTVLTRDALVWHPPQRQTALVASLGLSTNEAGFLVLSGPGHTSRTGIFAAGDLASPMQSAIGGAAAGMLAAAGICADLANARLQG